MTAPTTWTEAAEQVLLDLTEPRELSIRREAAETMRAMARAADGAVRLAEHIRGLDAVAVPHEHRLVGV